MKYMKYLVAVVLALPLFAQAGLNLAEPQDLLVKAQTNRLALREVILDIEMNISEMRDQPTFEKYFFILDDLQIYSDKFRMDDFYPKLVQGLGLRMVSNGMRWLDVTKDSSDKLNYYVKWMNSDNLSRFLSAIEYQLASVKDRARLATMASNVEALLPLIDKLSQNESYLQSGFRRLATDAAVAILKDPTLTSAEVAFWIGKINIASSLSEYVDLLTQEILNMGPDKKDAGKDYLTRLLLVNAQVYKISSTPPTWLVNGVGDSVVELLLRLVRYEVVVSTNEFSQALETLNARQVQSLAQQWMAYEKLPSQNYAALFIDYSKLIAARARKIGLNRDSEEFLKWLGRVAAPIMAQKLSLEGHYELVNEKGQKWYFTLAYARENMLIAALGNADGSVYKTFYNISYSAVSNSFVASQREPDTDHDMNPPAKFTVNEKGEITLIDIFVRDGVRTLKGHRVQSFPDMWASAKEDSTVPDGVYAGTIVLPSGQEMNVKIYVTSFNGYTLGRYDSSGVTVDFNIGSKGTDGVLILTSGRNLGASWLQFRAVVTPEGLKGYAIVGARGQSPVCTFLKRIDND